MSRISFHCERNIPEDLNQLLSLAKDTSAKVMNLVEDKAGLVVQLDNFQNITIDCGTTVEGSGASAAVYAEDDTFLFEIPILFDFDIGWQLHCSVDELVGQCESSIRDWLEVQQ